MKKNTPASARFDVKEFKQKLKNDEDAEKKLRSYMNSILKEKEKFNVNSDEAKILRDEFNRADAVLHKVEYHKDLNNEDTELLLTSKDKKNVTGGKRRKTRRNRKSKKTRKSRKNHRKSKRRSRR